MLQQPVQRLFLTLQYGLRRQLRTVRDISELLIQHDVLYVMFMPNFYARFTVRP